MRAWGWSFGAWCLTVVYHWRGWRRDGRRLPWVWLGRPRVGRGAKLIVGPWMVGALRPEDAR